MDLSVDDFISGLLNEETLEEPSDTAHPDQIKMELPPWYDEKKFNQARKFYWKNSFAFAGSMIMGLIAVFSIPTIIRVLVGSRRSTSVVTAYRRYLSTLLHTVSWFETELKPGSKSWKSLYTVRTRHARATLSSKKQGTGIVSQRDVALTQFGFIGFSILKPHFFGVMADNPDDWEAYIHFWRVIGHMIGLQDKYNICRKNFDETREVLEIILKRVYTPALDNVPEYFEHMSAVMIDGMRTVNPTLTIRSAIYYARYLADVPGYMLKENERLDFVARLKKQLKGKPLNTGVESTELISKCAIEGLPKIPPRVHYLEDYETLEKIPAYTRLSWYDKFRLNGFTFLAFLASTFFGRWYVNVNYVWSLFLMKYFPYGPMFKFGIKQAYVNMFMDSIKDDTKPIVNTEYNAAPAESGWKQFIDGLW